MSIFALCALVLLLICAAIAVTMRVLQRRRAGRIVQYAAPNGLSLVAAAVLTRDDKKAAAAELIHLALRGNVRFLAPDAGSKQMRVELLSGPPMADEQRALLKAVFGAPRSAKSRRLAISRSAKLSSGVRDVINAAILQLRRTGVIVFDGRWPVVVLKSCAVAALLLCLVSLVWNANTGVSLMSGVGAAVLAVVTWFATPTRVRVFSPESFAVRDHLAGLNDYISLAEADRLRFLQSPNGALTHSLQTAEGRVEALVLNEKLLPYAVLFGHEREWAKLLESERRELATSEVFDALDSAHLFISIGDSALDLGLTELVEGLRDLDIDLSLLASLDLPDIEVGAFSFDL